MYVYKEATTTVQVGKAAAVCIQIATSQMNRNSLRLSLSHGIGNRRSRGVSLETAGCINSRPAQQQDGWRLYQAPSQRVGKAGIALSTVTFRNAVPPFDQQPGEQQREARRGPFGSCHTCRQSYCLLADTVYMNNQYVRDGPLILLCLWRRVA